jgi:L-serine dehydratase
MGLVQSPCIERNATAAVEAVKAASRALRGEAWQRVPLDTIIKKLYEMGREMMGKYKETSLGGFAVNVVEC